MVNIPVRMREKTQDRICYIYSCLRSCMLAADLYAAGVGQIIGKVFLMADTVVRIFPTVGFFLLRLLFGERISCLEFVFMSTVFKGLITSLMPKVS